MRPDIVPGGTIDIQRVSMARAPQDEPAVESFPAQNSQFFVTATINGYAVHFVVDTGATYVSLTPEDARRLGFDLSTLDWNIRTHTANGDAANAAVNLADLRLGDIVEYNVPALVMKTGGGLSLLGGLIAIALAIGTRYFLRG